MVIALTGIKDIQEDSLTIQTLFISQFFSYTVSPVLITQICAGQIWLAPCLVTSRSSEESIHRPWEVCMSIDALDQASLL